MLRDQNMPGYNQTNPMPEGGNKKTLPIKLTFIAIGAVLIIALLLISFHHSTPKPKENKYTISATNAARKLIPGAVVTNVKVSGGFAIATVSNPHANSQSFAGNTTIFKVNKDGSMKQIASSSYFSPLELLGLGIPLATQAKLTDKSIGSVEQNLANQCGYKDGDIGYDGFGGSFKPGQWQIDAATLQDIIQRVNTVINNQNDNSTPDKAIICVNATQNNSNFVIDKTTYISTFTVQVQFISRDGTLAMHTLTFSIGPNNYRKYTLDGQNI